MSSSSPDNGAPRGRQSVPWMLLAAAAIGVLLLAGCDIQRKLLPIPVGGFWERLTPSADQIAYFPDWRGETIAYSSFLGGAFRIVTIQADGSGRKVFPGTVTGYDWTARWVNDSLLVFSSSKSGSYDLWYLNVRSGTVRRLTNFAGNEVSPAPRPGTPGLAYAESPSPPLDGRIVLMPDTSADSTNLHYVSPDSLKAGEPDWDPTGTRLCFSAQGSDTTRHIWIAMLSPGDTTVTQVTTGSCRDLSPRFSSDGTRVVFTSNRNGTSGVWVVNAAGQDAGLRQVATDDPGATVDTPAWSPDSHSLVVASDGRGLPAQSPALWFLQNLGL